MESIINPRKEYNDFLVNYLIFSQSLIQNQVGFLYIDQKLNPVFIWSLATKRFMTNESVL